VLAEVSERDAFELVVRQNGRCRLRREHLPAVARGHDSRGAVDAHPVVAALVGDVGLTGVHAHADAELGAFWPFVGGERALPVGRG
jgi:hypothetical protein